MPKPSVTICLSNECRQFLLDIEPALKADLRAVLEGAQRLQVAEAEARAWYVLALLRLEALRLLEHVWVLRTSLPPGDPRYAIGEQCLAAIAEGIKRSDDV